MIRRNYFFLGFLVLIAGLTLLSCGPSVSGETDRWNTYNKTIDGSIVTYPAFGKFFDQKRLEIKTSWDSLGSISDEKERAKKMREVNAALGEIAIKLREFEIAARNIPTLIPKIQKIFDNNKLKYPEIDRYRVQFEELSRQGLSASSRALELVMTTFPATYDEAYQKFSNAWRLQKESYDSLNKLKDDMEIFIKTKIDEEQEKKNEKAADTKAPKK